VNDPEQISAARHMMGLDQPLWTQFAIWATRVAQGDLGRSYISHYPVADLVVARLPATIVLAVVALLVAAAVAFPCGIIAAARNGSAFDLLVSMLSVASLAVPTFWLGILLVLLFSVWLGWLPASGYADVLREPGLALRLALLPALTVGLPTAGTLTRFIRASVLETLSDDYIRTARSKGLTEGNVLLRHNLPNALVPVITVLGITFGRMLSGVVIAEAIFNWPGLGQLILQGIAGRDYTLVQGSVLLIALIFIAVNTVTDVLYGVVDPRIRLSS